MDYHNENSEKQKSNTMYDILYVVIWCNQYEIEILINKFYTI